MTQQLEVRTGHVADVELSAALPALRGTSCGEGDAECRILVRVHGHPVDVIGVRIGPAGLGPSELASLIWSHGSGARAHLRADGLAAPEPCLAPGGLPAPEHTPRCLLRRRDVLRRAPSMTVLVATREHPDSLRRCLDSVAQLDYPDFDVVVVDNAPRTDATARAVAERGGACGPARLRYVRHDEPGLATAHNRGLRHVSGEWVAITDDDVVVDRQWLAAIAEAATRTRSVACVTGLILAAELETPAQRLIEEAGGFGRGFSQRIVDMGLNRPGDPLFPLTPGRLGSGANMAFDTGALRSIGGFDSLLGAGSKGRGGDDLAAFVDMLVAGYSLVYQPSAMLWHYHRRDYASLRAQSYNYGVGLGACLTSVLVRHPALAGKFAGNVVPGIRHFRSRDSAKNTGKSADYPADLDRAELRGVLHGPFAYAASACTRARRFAARGQ